MVEPNHTGRSDDAAITAINMETTTDRKPPTDARQRALRHIVYADLLSLLPAASYDQAATMCANLRLGRPPIRLWNLRVTPDVAETSFRGLSLAAIEVRMNRTFGERLSTIAGFYRRNDAAPFRLNLPFKCALYGYSSTVGNYAGILCQPLNRFDMFFLLSSAKFGGPKAIPLSAKDQMYFTQYKETSTL